jgi:hypothetical protein
MITTGIGTGDFHFSSGTGRFEGVSGLAQLVVTQNLVTGAFEFTMVGSFNY